MKSLKTRRLCLLALTCACSTIALTTARAQDGSPTPAFVLKPTLTVQGTYTDNADLSSNNRNSDWITRGQLGIDADVNTGRTTLTSHGDFAYDRYARQTALSGYSLSAQGNGAYTILPDELAITARGTITDGYTSTFNTSATDRSGVDNRIQLATYAIGPELTMGLGNVGDLDAAARFSQVFYAAADASTVSNLPEDDNIAQIVARFDTGKRFSGYQSLSTAEFDGDDHGYRSGNAIETLFFPVLPSLRVLGRAGYESVFQPGVTQINAPVATAGLEYTINEKSQITVEGGTRYNRAIWAAKANIQLGSRLAFTADYSVSIQPDQIYVANTLGDFVDRTAQLPSPIVPGSFRYSPNLYNQTSLNKTAEAHLIYTDEIQSIDGSVNWTDRDFFTNIGEDKTLISNLAYTRRVRPRLNLTLAANYARTFDSPLFGASENYRGSATIQYQLGRRTDVNFSYDMSFGRELIPNGIKIQEHAFVIAITRRF
jgi:uncharacterized protein (PEP-CTERM system associated)